MKHGDRTTDKDGSEWVYYAPKTYEDVCWRADDEDMFIEPPEEA